MGRQVRRPFDSFFDQGLKGWLIQYAAKHHWRMSSWVDLEDLIQEGYVVFAFCKDRYYYNPTDPSREVRERAHFMALFKRVYASVVSDMARRNQRDIPQMVISQLAIPGTEEAALEALGGGIDGDAELAATIAKASIEVRKLLAAINDGTFDDRRYAKWHCRGGLKRETTNQFFNRVMKTVDMDYSAEVRELLFPGTVKAA